MQRYAEMQNIRCISKLAYALPAGFNEFGFNEYPDNLWIIQKLHMLIYHCNSTNVRVLSMHL